MNAASADFAATAPWSGIINRPANGSEHNSVLLWDDSQKKWVPVTLAQLKQLLAALP